MPSIMSEKAGTPETDAAQTPARSLAFTRFSWSPEGTFLAVPNSVNNGVFVAGILKRKDWEEVTSLVGHESVIDVAVSLARLRGKTPSPLKALSSSRCRIKERHSCPTSGSVSTVISEPSPSFYIRAGLQSDLLPSELGPTTKWRQSLRGLGDCRPQLCVGLAD